MSAVVEPPQMNATTITHLLNEVAAKAAQRSGMSHPEDIGLAMTAAIEDAVLVMQAMNDADVVCWVREFQWTP